MKTLIIYKSVHQMNTEKVAKAMAEAINADLRKVEEVTPAMLEEYDLIGFGSGIYYGKHHKTLLDFVAGLPQQGKAAFVFSTSGGALKSCIGSYGLPWCRKNSRSRANSRAPGSKLSGCLSTSAGSGRGVRMQRTWKKPGLSQRACYKRHNGIAV